VRRLLILVSAIMLVDTMFFAALTPLLPHYSEELGLSKAGAGLLTAAFGIGTLVGSIPAGLFAARAGVKPTVLTGLALLSVTSLVFGFAESVWLLDGARFLQGIGAACTWTGALAWLVSAAPPERRGEMIGTAVGAGIGGALIGPALGGAAASLGTEPVFSAVAVVGATIAAIVAFSPATPRGDAQTLAVLASRIRDRQLLRGMWLVCLPAILFGVLSVLGPLRLDVLGFGAAAIGVTFLVSAGLEAALSPVLGRISDRRGPASVVVVAVIASAAVSLLLPWPDRAWLLAVFVVAGGLAYGAFWVPAMAILSRGAEDTGLDQSFAFALMNLAWAAGQGFGSLAGGAVGDRLGDAVPYTACALLSLATLVALRRSRLASAPGRPRSQTV
jgi:MFS family permease